MNNIADYKDSHESDRCLAADLAGDFIVISDDIAHALLSIRIPKP